MIKVTKKFQEEDWQKLDDFMNEHPLFNNKYTEEDFEKNEYLQGLAAMKYDATSEEIMMKLYVSIQISRPDFDFLEGRQ